MQLFCGLIRLQARAAAHSIGHCGIIPSTFSIKRSVSLNATTTF